ncbi:MAG TPA: zinc metallopeptidase [Anaerolineales bacterium]|nr:zinc metallopeptidase [Anaerolineales bacterium]
MLTTGFYNTNYLFFMIPAFLLMMFAQFYVRSAYNRWSRVQARSGISGAEAARRLMQFASLYGVRIEPVGGKMTDHYDPRSKVLRLSQGVYNSTSVAALAIAAHELGHAMQDKEGYAPLRLRSLLVPAVNIGSYLGWIFIIIGLLLEFTGLAWLGVIIFSGGAVFALATLPVEFDASTRARRLLREAGIVQTAEEQRGVKNVLNAAALTYVAALVTAILQLLYYVSLVAGRRD